MKRISTDEAYLENKTLVIDADGIPVDLKLLNGDKAVEAAERVERIAESTSWSGDRLTVNGKTSPPLTGPKGADGTVAFDALTSEQKAQLKGAPGEVSKAQLDAAVAAEKARTVGMVWMVETEDQAKAKETSCQKGDFIQVTQTGNIYKVV